MPQRHTPVYCQHKVERVFAPEQFDEIQSWLRDVRARLELSRRHTELMLGDHVDALERLTLRGLTLSEAMHRLDPAQLGDFYLVERTDWYPLDTAAKIYPMSMSLQRMPVFRLSCYLKRPVEPALLQIALSYAIRRFPYFATTIKCGFFWHYIDGARRRFSAKPETERPCAVMKLGNVTSPALRVVYYQNRISVEFFHILADGTGGALFLRTLVKTYLRLLGEEIPDGPDTFDITQPPDPAEWSDDFSFGDEAAGAHGFADKPALQMRGLISYEQPDRVLHYNFSTQALLDVAHKKGVTLTALMLGVIALACRDASPKHAGKRKIQIQLPVNMRKFYPSRTLRNFSMYCGIRLAPGEITTLNDILPKINEQMKLGAAKESLNQTMKLARRLVKCLRFVPLIVKRPIAYLAYGALGDAMFTTTFSNLGNITIAPELAAHMEKFDFVLGPSAQNRAACSMCSFGDRAVFTVTKNTALPLFEDALYRHFIELGLEPYMEGTS